MEKKKIDRIIQIVRENMVVGAGGFTGAADPKGPVAGFDPVMGAPIKRKKNYVKGGQGSRKKWLDYLKSYNGRRNQSSNS
jgi:hypothetical protein